MQNAERTRRLSNALDLIRQVRNDYPVTEEVCDCCGLTRYSDWDAKQKRDVLGACISRLEKLI